MSRKWAMPLQLASLARYRPPIKAHHVEAAAVGAMALVACLAMNGCGASIAKHGQHFQENDLQQVQSGMSQEQVRTSLGTPTTTASTGRGQAFYYIGSTTSQTSFFLPTETDRQVVAVYFTPTGTVERVANYGMKDGKVFDFISRTTPAAYSNDEGVLKSLFRNLGQKQIFGE